MVKRKIRIFIIAFRIIGNILLLIMPIGLYMAIFTMGDLIPCGNTILELFYVVILVCSIPFCLALYFPIMKFVIRDIKACMKELKE